MTSLLWVGMGVSLSACVLHGVLGAMRPIRREHVSFATLMALQCGYLYFEYLMYHAPSAEAAVSAVRWASAVTFGLLAVTPWFACAYTGLRLRWRPAALFWALIVAMFIYNEVSPYGIYFASAPAFSRVTKVGGEVVSILVPPLGVASLVYIIVSLSVIIWSLLAGLVTLFRGRRHAGLMLSISLTVLLLAAILDFVHDFVRGTWPYVFEYGVMTWTLAMSADLAVLYRSKDRQLASALETADEHAARLERMLAAFLLARDKLNTPLQTLELGLALLKERVPERAEEIAPLTRAVARLTEAGRLLRTARFVEGTVRVAAERGPAT